MDYNNNPDCSLGYGQNSCFNRAANIRNSRWIRKRNAEDIHYGGEGEMSKSIAAKNKAIVLEAFETLFNKRDYAAAERFWSPNYIQHSAHIAPGRDGLFGLVKSLPDTLKYEHDMIVAEGNLVIVHGRFSGFGAPASWIAADILVMEDGVLVEHWDVIEDEARRAQSKSGNPMFGSSFPE